MHVFDGIDGLIAGQGTELGPTDWLEITQDRVDAFADATEDHQWIHVDPQRAADGPFGATIAHGLLTLSLVPYFSQRLFRVDGVAMALNYGYDKIRFVSPVPVGSRLRARGVLTAADPLQGAVQVTVTTTVEIEGAAKPAAVVASITRFVG